MIELTEIKTKVKPDLYLGELKPGDIFKFHEASISEPFHIFCSKDVATIGRGVFWVICLQTDQESYSYYLAVPPNEHRKVTRYLPANEWQVREEE
jgi:hypothetical protein